VGVSSIGAFVAKTPPSPCGNQKLSGEGPPSGAEACPVAVGYDFHAKGGKALCGFLAYSSVVH